MKRVRLAAVAGVTMALVAGLLTGWTSASAAAPAPDAAAPAAKASTPGQKPAKPKTRSCVYSAHSIAELNEYSGLVGQPVSCATVFNDSTPNWAQWSNPWFTHQTDPDLDWAGWVRDDPTRHLVITQNLFPSSEQSTKWLVKGASGQYDTYATALAQNLVAAGLGSSSIRLANEANGTWYPYSVPSDTVGQKRWRVFWARIVTAMRAVPGADFSFVWSVNYQVRNLTLPSFYPGNAYVDVVGLDAYDMGSTATTARYKVMSERAGGMSTVLAFALAHHKPLAFPEWGLMPTGAPHYGGGDDPGYVNGIAGVVASQDVAFAGYWYAHSDTQAVLQNSPASLAALRQMLTTLT